MSYRRARLHRLADRYDNPMPESTISPSQELWIWLQVGEGVGASIGTILRLFLKVFRGEWARLGRQHPVAKFIVPDWRDKVDSGTWFSYPARQATYVGWWAGKTTLCRSQLYPPVRDYEFGYWIPIKEKLWEALYMSYLFFPPYVVTALWTNQLVVMSRVFWHFLVIFLRRQAFALTSAFLYGSNQAALRKL